MKPILFNTEMVEAILEGRKTMTRRAIKVKYRPGEVGFQVITNATTGAYVRVEVMDEWDNETRYLQEPCKVGDILWVRETWARGCMGGYIYKAGHENADRLSELRQWRPSSHMPKEAARMFLRVTDVRAERLQDISLADVRAEGFDHTRDFADMWNKTAGAGYRAWDYPWVWVIRFERCEKPPEVRT